MLGIGLGVSKRVRKWQDRVAEGGFLQADAIEAAIGKVALAVPAAFPDGLPTSLNDWAADLAGTYSASTEVSSSTRTLCQSERKCLHG